MKRREWYRLTTMTFLHVSPNARFQNWAKTHPKVVNVQMFEGQPEIALFDTTIKNPKDG